jgi:hypothetical protein
MTEYLPESSWSESAQPSSHDFWESTRPAPFQEQRLTRPSSRAQRRPAAALAADVNELLESMARKRVPRLDAVRARLAQARAGLRLEAIEDAVHTMHASTTALDFLGSRSGQTAAEFVRQGQALLGASTALRHLGAAFVQRHDTEAPVTRLVWIDLALESGSLQKRVRQAARWLAEMDQDLVTRRRAASSELAARAIEELARHAQAMHTRVQGVHRLCSHARSVHLVCEQLGEQRSTLCTTLRDKVGPASWRLEQELRPLLEVGGYRALVPTELMAAIDARHELQVVLTQAGAQIIRLQEGDGELATQLSWMEHKARNIA